VDLGVETRRGTVRARQVNAAGVQSGAGGCGPRGKEVGCGPRVRKGAGAGRQSWGAEPGCARG
jgi:hypothetical protein